MRSLVDLTGQRFDKLVVIGQSGRSKCGNVLWWRKHKRLPDFVFESIRKRAIADLDDAHRLAENAQ